MSQTADKALSMSFSLRSTNLPTNRPYGSTRPTCRRPQAPKKVNSQLKNFIGDDLQIDILVNNAAIEVCPGMQYHPEALELYA
ncbi:hypothetical protein N7495_002467 [Penicillium taxi]|uniref:uncharacterized protein n=1 Tax=Penicillium taxi TaxID=168475 RepID=UPI0025452A6D|nr:uncharacterized protein N7495_002467 [Penicillium taxi]KAJ5901939.1 hypothetical protein N7495_002467 [Penicillium taxi]